MKIKEFVEDMSKSVNTTMKEKQILDLVNKKLEIKSYLPIKDKKSLVDKIIGDCLYYENYTFRIDSIDCYIYLVMYTINAYTNLEIDDVEDAYDVLSASGMMSVILKSLGDEYDYVSTLLNLKRDEILSNNSVEMQLGRFCDELSNKIDDLVDSFKDITSDLNLDKLLESLNIDKNDVEEFIAALNQ